jgi:threonine aldolase
VQFTETGTGGMLRVEEFVAACKPRGHVIFPPTTLLEIENTHNRAGGVVVPQPLVRALCDAARERGVTTFLDGARLWNAAAASGLALAELAAPFDLVAMALSKGLGAPGGSLLAGPREIIGRATRYRRMFGGAMRQTGIYAAAGLYAIEHHRARLTDDHANARRIAQVLATNPRVELDLATVQTNIVVFRLRDGAADAATVAERARGRGVLLLPFAARTLRVVTHLDVSAAQCERAAQVLAELI